MAAPPAYTTAVQYDTAPRPPSYHSATHTESIAAPASVERRPKLGEIKAYDTSRERSLHEELGDLYGILKVTEALEKAYGRDAVGATEYAEACSKLISQFKTSEAGLISGGKITSIDQYLADYAVECPRAYHRLVTTGVPATVMHASHDDRQEGVLVAETVQYFITAMDALKLEQRAVDEIQPLISDLMNALTKIKGLPADFEGFNKLRNWLQELNKKRAVESIEEDDARQLIYDLDTSYGLFLGHLKKGRTST
jgi:ESCRT-I complex subunit VPS28